MDAETITEINKIEKTSKETPFKTLTDFGIMTSTDRTDNLQVAILL